MTQDRTEPAPRPGGDRAAVAALRRFGTTAADLDVDLRGARRPEVLTNVLMRCLSSEGRSIDSGSVWNMTVGSRIAWLLAIADLEGQGPFSIGLRCAQPDCRQEMEIEVTAEEALSMVPHDAGAPIVVEASGAQIEVRRPTGADQLRWLRLPPGEQTPAAILRTLVVDGPAELTEEQAAAVENALDESDPLVRFTVTTACPACGVSAQHETSLTDCALRVLQRVQQRLIEDVHVLARAYGWREPEVLSLPDWRRARYLALVASEVRA